MQHLQPDTILQNGKYKIERVLGQGGFGITYLATQTISIEGPIGSIKTEIKLAVKEFFMSDVCNREPGSNHISVPSVSSRQLVERFKEKFIKEARNISELKHPYIIKVVDVFEENGTAYYVMEYHGNGSLCTLLNSCHTLSETEALRYIRQIADALHYIHNRQMNHLDVNPENILLDDSNNTVLIDFGLSKHFDETDSLTNTTPVVISHGYAPLEQYRAGGVSEFSPATDIYSLGATLYRMLIGKNPPDANEVNEDGLPTMPTSISSEIRTAIEAAMQPRRKDRPQNIDAFLSLLGNVKNTDDEVETVIEPPHNPVVQTPETDETQILQEEFQTDSSNANAGEQKPPVIENKKNPKLSYLKWLAPLAIVLAIACYFGFKGSPKPSDSVLAESPRAYTGNIDGYPYVDLGLSVKWAAYNVGADSPEGYGDYFAWGETRPKSVYDWSTYKYCKGSSDSLTKYNNTSSCGTVDNKTVLEAVDDAATANWGYGWRMPTFKEWHELNYKCTWTWTTRNGVHGYKVTGTNGNSIFIPAAGYRDDSSVNHAGSYGFYWSASLYESRPHGAWGMDFLSDAHSSNINGRDYGHSVRAVAR